MIYYGDTEQRINPTGLAEFNLSNYIIMLDDEISILREQLEALEKEK